MTTSSQRHQRSQSGHKSRQKHRRGDPSRARNLVHAQLERSSTGERVIALAWKVALCVVQLLGNTSYIVRTPALPTTARSATYIGASDRRKAENTYLDHSSPA